MTYKVSVNVHKQNPDEFVWHELATGEAWSAADGLKALCKDSIVYLFTQKGADGKVYEYSAQTSQLTNEHNLGGQIPDDVNSIQLYNGKFYAVSDGQVTTSVDGVNWTAETSGQRLNAMSAPVNLQSMAQISRPSIVRPMEARGRLKPSTLRQVICRILTLPPHLWQ